MQRNYVLIVDAYSTGSLLAKAWHRTHDILHVRSSTSMPQAFVNSSPFALFSREFEFHGDVDQLVSELDRYVIDHVVCGSEFGVELTDSLAARLQRAGNNPDSSVARRDKFLMHQRLLAADVPTARCATASSSNQAQTIYSTLQTCNVVVKPTNSAGSDDVYLCSNADEVEACTQSILGKTNLMQRRNEQVLVQTHLQGTEYIVNSVTAHGHHYICDVWESVKTRSCSGRLIYDCEKLLDPLDTKCGTITDYIYRVLDALDITWGPAHSELILTDNGPVLLETGARLSGLANPKAVTLATGSNQVELSVQAFLQPEAIEAVAGSRYELQQHSYAVNLIAPHDATLDTDTLSTRCRALPSFQSLRLRIDNNQARETVDLNSSPGVIFLVDTSHTQVQQDYEAIRRLEEALYTAIPKQITHRASDATLPLP